MNRLYIPFAVAALAAFSASAQEQLTKEITIEREIVPEVHAASRPNLFPTQLKFTTAPRSLDAIDYGKTSDFGPHIATLEPALTAPAAPLTPYRGYVDLGYFPAANIGVSAGYSIISTASTGLNIHAQFNNRQYKARPFDGLEKGTFRHLQGRIGVDFSHQFGNAGKLQIATGVNLASFNRPWSVIDRSVAETMAVQYPDTEIPAVQKQSVFGWETDALWNGRANSHLTYYIGAGFDIYNFSKALPLGETTDATGATVEFTLPAVHQTGFNIDLGVAERISGSASAGLDINASFLHYNSYMQPYTGSAAGDNGLTDLPGGKTVGVASLTPYYRLTSNIYTLKLGARIDFTFNSGKKFHVAPDVLFGVNPAEGFGASLHLGGGEKLNPLQELAEFSPYICQSMAYGVSNRPITGDFALRFGPVKGASLTLNLSYAAANNWLLPYNVENQLVFAPSKLRSFKAGATARWSFRRLLAFEASFETVFGNDEKNTWLEWRDRARRVFSASAEITPIKNLSVSLAYELRMKRSMPAVLSDTELTTDITGDTPDAYGEPYRFDLKNVSSLNVGAAYRLTGAFTVFGRVENLLNTRSYIMPLLPDQGLTGLVGVGYKF